MNTSNTWEEVISNFNRYYIDTHIKGESPLNWNDWLKKFYNPPIKKSECTAENQPSQLEQK